MNDPRQLLDSRRLWPLLLVLAAQTAVFVLLLSSRGYTSIDDAYISFRYAAHWARGLGLTFNPGVPVEGFSNPVWTLLLGVLDRLGPAPDRTAPVLAWASLAGLLFLTASLIRTRCLSRVGSWILWAGMGLDAGLVVWATSGLETALTAFLVAAWLVRAATLKDRFLHGVGLGLLGALLALSRPEGILWASWGLVWLIWGAWAAGRVIWGVVLGMLPFAAYLAFRLEVYGRLVPNTFFAKMEATTLGWKPAVTGLGEWALAHGALLALLVVLGLSRTPVPRSRPRSPRRWPLLLWGWFALQVLFVLAAGGDWMGSCRYLAPVLPVFYLGVAELWENRKGPVRRNLATGLGLLLLLHLVLGWAVRDRIPDYTRTGRVVGTWLARTADPGDTLAVTAAGAIPYYSDLFTLDVLGINDPGVSHRAPHRAGAWAPGHHRYDIEDLLRARPGWIVWDFGVEVNRHRMRRYRSWSGDLSTLDYRSRLLADPLFQAEYEVDSSAPPETRRAYTVFRRRER